MAARCRSGSLRTARVSGYRAARRAGRVLAGAIAGALVGAAGGGVGGLCYVFFGKSAINVPAGVVLGLMGVRPSARQALCSDNEPPEHSGCLDAMFADAPTGRQQRLSF